MPPPWLAPRGPRQPLESPPTEDQKATEGGRSSGPHPGLSGTQGHPEEEVRGVTPALALPSLHAAPRPPHLVRRDEGQPGSPGADTHLGQLLTARLLPNQGPLPGVRPKLPRGRLLSLRTPGHPTACDLSSLLVVPGPSTSAPSPVLLLLLGRSPVPAVLTCKEGHRGLALCS